MVQAETRLGAGEARQGVGEERASRAEGKQTEANTRADAAEDRLDAVELLAKANVEAMREVRGLRDDIAAVDTRRGRDLDLAKVAMALVVLLVIGVGAVVISNRPILKLIESTVTPGGQINQDMAERATQRNFGLVTENDCRHRRAVANLPPPPTTVVIKDGQAIAQAKMPCGDLPDSPAGFQSPPKSETPPPSKSGGGGGFNPVPYALALAIGVTIGIGVAIYRTQRREDKR